MMKNLKEAKKGVEPPYFGRRNGWTRKVWRPKLEGMRSGQRQNRTKMKIEEDSNYTEKTRNGALARNEETRVNERRSWLRGCPKPDHEDQEVL